jgi:hypothetical protein
MSDAKTGANHPMFGRTHSEDTRAQMSKSQQLMDRLGENHPMFGKSHTDETRTKMSEAKTGENNPMFLGACSARAGKSHTDESPRRALMSEVKSGCFAAAGRE